jgi:hypothetical protein
MRTATALTILLTAVLASSGCDREPTSPSAVGSSLPSDVPRSDKGGNSANVDRCRNYASWYTREGQPFASFSECVSYGAKGSQLINTDALTCLNGGWQSLGNGTTPFTSEQECIDYAGGTGTPVAVGADLYVSTDPTTIGCGPPSDPAYCTSIHIRVYNPSSMAVTVSWTFNGTYQETSSLGTEIWPLLPITNPNCSYIDNDVAGTFTGGCTNVLLPGSTSIFVAHVVARVGSTQSGTVSITSSSLPDPNPSNNSFSWNFTAASPF